MVRVFSCSVWLLVTIVLARVDIFAKSLDIVLLSSVLSEIVTAWSALFNSSKLVANWVISSFCWDEVFNWVEISLIPLFNWVMPSLNVSDWLDSCFVPTDSLSTPLV